MRKKIRPKPKRAVFRGAQLLPEHQELASQIIYHNNNNTGYDFPHIAVLPQHIRKQEKNPRFQRPGCHPAAHKTGKLRHNSFCRPVMASEHKGFICQIIPLLWWHAIQNISHLYIPANSLPKFVFLVKLSGLQVQ